MNFGAHSAFFADVGEVGGEAVAEIDHGRGQALFAQELCRRQSGAGGESGWGSRRGEVCVLKRATVSVAAEPPRSPVTKMRSPGFAPERRMALPLGAEPTTTMSARIPPGDWAISPPARVTWNASASRSRPVRKRSTQLCGRLRGKASDRNAAMGRPPMAAMSLSPRVRQRWPITSASVPLAPEVDAFQAEIGGHERFMAGRDSQDSAVVADAEANCRHRRFVRSADAGDDRLFGERQANSIYKRRGMDEGRAQNRERKSSNGLVTNRTQQAEVTLPLGR